MKRGGLQILPKINIEDSGSSTADFVETHGLNSDLFYDERGPLTFVAPIPITE